MVISIVARMNSSRDESTRISCKRRLNLFQWSMFLTLCYRLIQSLLTHFIFPYSSTQIKYEDHSEKQHLEIWDNDSVRVSKYCNLKNIRLFQFEYQISRCCFSEWSSYWDTIPHLYYTENLAAKSKYFLSLKLSLFLTFRFPGDSKAVRMGRLVVNCARSSGTGSNLSWTFYLKGVTPN